MAKREAPKQRDWRVQLDRALIGACLTIPNLPGQVRATLKAFAVTYDDAEETDEVHAESSTESARSAPLDGDEF